MAVAGVEVCIKFIQLKWDMTRSMSTIDDRLNAILLSALNQLFNREGEGCR